MFMLRKTKKLGAGIRKKSNVNIHLFIIICISTVVILVIGQKQFSKFTDTCAICPVEVVTLSNYVSSGVHDTPRSLSIRLYNTNSNREEPASRNTETQTSGTKNDVRMSSETSVSADTTMSINGSLITTIPNNKHNYSDETLMETSVPDTNPVISTNRNNTSNIVLLNTPSNTSCKQLLLRYLYVPIHDKLLSMIPEQCFSTDKYSEKLARILDSFVGNNLENVRCSMSMPNFLDVPRPLVALASFPGSGNTWTRLILEALTGIYTGSVYPDIVGKLEGSHACPLSGRVFIIKTHNSSTWNSHRGCHRSSLNFSRAIFIIRNPYDAVMAESNRKTSRSKTAFANETHYAGDKWSQYVQSMSNRWKDMLVYWLSEFDQPVHIVIYEDLKTRTLLETYRMMKFLNMNVNLHSLYCLLGKSQQRYLRAVRPDWMTKHRLFDQNMREYVNNNIISVLDNISKGWNLHGVIKNYIFS